MNRIVKLKPGTKNQYQYIYPDNLKIGKQLTKQDRGKLHALTGISQSIIYRVFVVGTATNPLLESLGSRIAEHNAELKTMLSEAKTERGLQRA